MNELTKYVTDEPAYYTLCPGERQRDLEEIQTRDVTAPTGLELLMAAFELYERMMDMGALVKGFDQDAFLAAICERADRQQDGYLYPELAMYMRRPQAVLGTFMVRQDSFRVRINDVQHSMAGCGLFLENYELLGRRDKNLYSQPKMADGWVRGFPSYEANFRGHTCVYGKKI